MTFNNLLYRDFRGAADGAPGTGLVNRKNNRAYVQSGNLRFPSTDYNYLEEDCYATGSDAQLDQFIEVLLPAGFVNGDTLALILRGQSYGLEGQIDPHPGERGGYFLQMARGSALSGGAYPRIQVGPISSASRNPAGLAGFYGIVPDSWDDAKGHWLRFGITGAVGTLTIEAWEDTGADTSGGNTDAAHGTKVVNWSNTFDNSGADFLYLQRPGVAALVGLDISGGNDGTDQDSKIAVMRVALQENVEVLPVDAIIPTLASRTTTVNTLNAAPVNGTDPITVEWFTLPNDRSLPAITGNKIGPGSYSNATKTVTHTHGDAAGTLRFYRYKATDSTTPTAGVATSAVLMVEALRPAPGALPALRADLLGGRKLLYPVWGDSITHNQATQDRVLVQLAANGITNVTIVNGAEPGTSLTESDGWRPDAARYPNVLEADVNLFERFMARIQAAVDANPGAMLVISGMILTNDAQRYNETITSELVQSSLEAFITEAHSRFPDALFIQNCQPYGHAGSISEPAHIAEIGWRQAIRDAIASVVSNGITAVVGDERSYYAIYTHPEYLSDGIHFSTAGSNAVGDNHADALMRTLLVDPGTVATPAISPAGGSYVGAQSVTITCATAEADIRVTTDGSTPTADSPLYSGAITAPVGTTVIKAKAFKAEMTDSSVASSTYVVSAESPSGGVSAVTVVNQVVMGGTTQQLLANVVGSGAVPSQAVTWTKITGAIGDTISGGGLVSAGAAGETQRTMTVRATSVADNTKSANATITIPAAVESGGTGSGLTDAQDRKLSDLHAFWITNAARTVEGDVYTNEDGTPRIRQNFVGNDRLLTRLDGE